MLKTLKASLYVTAASLEITVLVLLVLTPISFYMAKLKLWETMHQRVGEYSYALAQ